MKKTSFNPEKYGMVVCPVCKSDGYIRQPKRQLCPKCGGFGYVKDEKKDRNDEDKRETVPLR